jgi:branched-chain amino acid aminotransferase
MVESAKLAGNPVVLENDRFRKAIRNIIQSIGQEYEGDLRIRIILDLENQLGDLYVVISKLNILPEKFYQEGVNVTTCRVARDNPQAKLTGFISRADKVREIISEEYHEALIIDDENRILEGLTSNFFATKKGGLITPATGILLGTTRSLVLDVAAKNGIPIIYSQILLAEIKSIAGAFLTSASRGILPIRSINQELIGAGFPDKLTQFLRQKYLQRMMEELEPI